MNEIRAFVGHSFADDDERVVGKFLKHFERLMRVVPNFSWDHAEAAEPRELAEKVLRLISDKNVFIGICTKKERAVPPASLKKARFGAKQLKAEEGAFEWKTSDWIIQEIGLAIGRNLDLILLLENGLRQPGGLQGNIEYITFDREAPEASFDQILEMITALSPKDTPRLLAPPDPASTQDTEAKQDRPVPTNDDWQDPKPDWSQDDYNFALFNLIFLNELEEIGRIERSYFSTKEGSLDENRVAWNARREFLKISIGKSGSISNLRALAEANPGNGSVLAYLARALDHYEDFPAAAHAYDAAANVTLDTSERIRWLSRSAIAFTRAGMPDPAARMTNRVTQLAADTSGGEIRILKLLGQLAEIAKDDDVALAIAERLVELDPSDTATRFRLAHHHSERGNNDLALLHYIRVPPNERDAATWNNLGVVFQQLSLAAKSVNAYRKSKSMGETLAMTNLAEKLISEGFLSEGEGEIKKALAIEGYHKNVGRALSRLKELPDEENKKETELLSKTKAKSTFYAQFGRAVSRDEPRDISTEWEGPDCALRIVIEAKTFHAVGSFEPPPNPLSLFGALASSAPPPPRRVNVEYTGRLRGCAIAGHVTRRREGDPVPTLLDSSERQTTALMHFSDDAAQLNVMEMSRSSDPRYYSLKRKAT